MCEERIVKTLCRMCDDRCGIDVHLNKPMDLPLLLATIEEITGLPRPS